MFTQLFAESGLSLDRLKTLLEIGAAGSIVKAAGGDPVRQSQFSRQVKELEEFFRIKLIERHGKGTRLTPRGKELARISRFFLIGLSNFQRGCRSEEQVFRIGASATFIRQFLLPILSEPTSSGQRIATEVLPDEEIEHRLQDLTLDFGIVSKENLSHPLQLKSLGKWTLILWVPKKLGLSEKAAKDAFMAGELPLALATKELADSALELLEIEPRLSCDSFFEAKFVLENQGAATVLPVYMAPAKTKSFHRIRLEAAASRTLSHSFAWNPRLLRLNPHATRRRDLLEQALTTAVNKAV